MNYIDIWDKLLLIVDLVCNNYIFLIFLGLLLLLMVLKVLKVIDAKKMYLGLVIVYMVIFLVILFSDKEVLFETFDDVVNTFFRNVYFPSVYFYMFMFIVINIGALISVFSSKIASVYKRINLAITMVINSLFLMLLNIIGTNRLDVFDKSSIYTDDYALTLLELSSFIFIAWLVSLGLMAVIECIYARVSKNSVENVVSDEMVEDKNSVLMEDFKSTGYEQLRPEVSLVADVDTASLVVDEKVNSSNGMMVELDDRRTLEDSLPQIETPLVINDFVAPVRRNINSGNTMVANEIPVVMPIYSLEERTNINSGLSEVSSTITSDLIKPKVDDVMTESKVVSSNQFTLDDYKLFSKMLQVVQYNNIGKQSLTIDDMLSINLLTKFSINEYNLFKKMLQTVK